MTVLALPVTLCPTCTDQLEVIGYRELHERAVVVACRSCASAWVVELTRVPSTMLPKDATARLLGNRWPKEKP